MPQLLSGQGVLARRGHVLVTCPHMTFEPQLTRMIGKVRKDGQKNICSRLENDVFMRCNRWVCGVLPGSCCANANLLAYWREHETVMGPTSELTIFKSRTFVYLISSSCAAGFWYYHLLSMQWLYNHKLKWTGTNFFCLLSSLFIWPVGAHVTIMWHVCGCGLYNIVDSNPYVKF